jgi:hypothetical protein
MMGIDGPTSGGYVYRRDISFNKTLDVQGEVSTMSIEFCTIITFIIRAYKIMHVHGMVMWFSLAGRVNGLIMLGFVMLTTGIFAVYRR